MMLPYDCFVGAREVVAGCCPTSEQDCLVGHRDLCDSGAAAGGFSCHSERSRRVDSFVPALLLSDIRLDCDSSSHIIPTPTNTRHGFTGHEHLDKFALINMNGRAYDPLVGQFLSPDPFVQSATSSQSYNRYSYCWNNPLKYVDPSGYVTIDIDGLQIQAHSLGYLAGVFGNDNVESIYSRGYDNKPIQFREVVNSYTYYDPIPKYLGSGESINDYRHTVTNRYYYAMMGTDEGYGVWVFARSIEDDPTGVATHTFIKIKNKEGVFVYAYGPDQHDGKESIIGGSRLTRVYYNEDIDLANGTTNNNLKISFYVEPPEGMTVDEFTWQVQAASESFGDNPGIKYSVLTCSETTGNCNTSVSTILWRAGVSVEMLTAYGILIPGADWGWGTIRPWSQTEQTKAVQDAARQYELIKPRSYENASNNFFYQ